MKIITLLEATSADLYRKIDGLKAMINDPSTTPGEKENAAAAIKKLEARLAKEFPGQAKPSAKEEPKYAAYNSNSWGSEEWVRGMAKAAKEMDDLEKLKKSDPEAYKSAMMHKLEKMQTNLKYMRRQHIPGNVETADQLRSYAERVDSFIRKEFPDMWKDIEAKRKAANEKSYAYQDKKRAEKLKKTKDAVKKEGGGTTKTAGKQYEDALKKLYDSMKGVKYRPFGYPSEIGAKDDKWSSGAKFLGYMPYMPMGEIRIRWNKFDKKTQDDLRNAVEAVNTQGHRFNGFSPGQKQSLLNAMSPFKDPDYLKKQADRDARNAEWRAELAKKK